MKHVHKPILRLGSLWAVIAVAAGCPSNPADTTAKTTTKAATTTAKASSGGTSSVGKTSTPTPGPTNKPTANDTNGGTTATATPGTGGTTSPTATPTTKSDTGATTTGGATTTATATPTATPTTTTTGGTTGTTATATPTAGVATATPTAGPTATPTPAPIAANGGVVTTFAGTSNSNSNDGNANSAVLHSPDAIAAAGITALYVGQDGDGLVRRIDLVGAGNPVTTVAGSGTTGYHDGVGHAAQFGNVLKGMAVDAAGNVYVADTQNDVIRKIDMSDANNPVVSTIAGQAHVAGSNDAAGTSATFNQPTGLIFSGSILYVADTGNHKIRQIDTGLNNVVTTVAGSGTSQNSDGPGSIARFISPNGLALDGAGGLLVCDSQAEVIRRVDLADSSHGVTTIAGAGVAGFGNGDGQGVVFDGPINMAVGADGALYIVDHNNEAIRRMTLGAPYTVTNFAGGNLGTSDGTGTDAAFFGATGISLSGGALYVTDNASGRVRKIQ